MVKYRRIFLNFKKILQKQIFVFGVNIQKKNENIIETTNFKNLQKMEAEGGFRESVKNKYSNSKVNFFHLGPENKWKNNIDNETINLIENSFKNEMKELNYL